MLRVVQSIHREARLGKRMRMSPLPAWAVENARSRRKRQDVDESRDFTTVALLREDGLVLEEIMGVEVRLPPLTLRLSRRQKNTASRYTPTPSPVPPPISYAVQ